MNESACLPSTLEIKDEEYEDSLHSICFSLPRQVLCMYACVVFEELMLAKHYHHKSSHNLEGRLKIKQNREL